MHIEIHLSGKLMAEGLYWFLVEQGRDHVVLHGSTRTNRVAPDVLIVDYLRPVYPFYFINKLGR